MTNTTTSIAAVVETYIASWNEGDAERRRELVGATFADDARYVDPLMSGAGIEGIADMIGAAQAQFPGHRFELDFGPTRTMTSCASPGRSWAPGGTVAKGVDFATVASDGRLRNVTGFLETV